MQHATERLLNSAAPASRSSLPSHMSASPREGSRVCRGTLEPPNSTGVAMAEGLQGSICAKDGALDSPWPPTEAWLGCGVWKPAWEQGMALNEQRTTSSANLAPKA